MVSSTETREGWPLLTVETEANGDLKSIQQMKGVLPWLVRWALRAGTRGFLPQAVVPGRLSLKTCLWSHQT
jgi:hypothetical protein